ncbi:hypothetical protein CRI94_16880 [Longibacter salinarum]|uniref:IPT/TIG domain-containing protein n=1 Tax=Longibacter salinarum TaxID=1850348 RepID=A0A2A8CTR3_9BACT|nr:IPT/TIG domain-containing protein [Longibacter salinarum]PEN11095.1 hypothetical protein CRI94_16880 [Longibacter salinarum]
MQLPSNLRHILSVVAMFAVILVGCDSGGSGGGSDVPEPSITGVSPTEGAIGTELTLEGSDFETGANVTVDGVAASSVTVESPTRLFAVVPSGITTETPVDVTVLNNESKTASEADAFTAIPPKLSFVNSATRPSGQVGSTVILDGDAFGDVQGTGTVYFNYDESAGTGIAATIQADDDWTNSFIVTTVPSGASDGPVVVETEVGVSESIPFNVTDGASFSPSNINWTQTSSLPTGVSSHDASFAQFENANGDTKRYVYVTGGIDAQDNALTQAIGGELVQQGEVSSWAQVTDLPNSLAHHATVAATRFNSRVDTTGHLYSIGGIDASSNVVSSVNRAQINPDGTLGTWNSETALPQPLHNADAVLFRSAIYVVGGATTGNAPVATVYKAEIDTSGTIGTWEQQQDLPTAIAHHGLVSFGGYLYTVGGNTAAVDPNSNTNSNTRTGAISNGEINLRTGEISGWSANPNELGKSREKHSTLVSGGFVFVSSGIYSAAAQGSSENTYAQINSDGTIGSFSGATGSNTLLSEGGNNLYNQAAVSYTDSQGVAHVLIIGGDDVNVPGNKQADVLYY